MKIIVLLKRTPDTETKVQISADGKQLDHSKTNFIINPYDEFAIEEAVRVKEKAGSGEVVIVSFGPTESKESIMRALAMGGDRGVLINNEGLEDLDSLKTSEILSEVIKSENADLVFCGKQGIDADNMHVGTMTAEMLGWPHVNVANSVKIEGENVSIEREVEGSQIEVYEAQLPLLIGANKALNEPRYTPLPAIIKAKKKPYEEKKVADFGLNPETLKSQVQVTVETYEYPAEKGEGKVLQGQPVDVMVDELVKLLRDEAKVL